MLSDYINYRLISGCQVIWLKNPSLVTLLGMHEAFEFALLTPVFSLLHQFYYQIQKSSLKFDWPSTISGTRKC